MALKRGEIIYRADQKIEYVYSPEEAVIAMVDITDDRRAGSSEFLMVQESIATMLGVR